MCLFGGGGRRGVLKKEGFKHMININNWVGEWLNREALNTIQRSLAFILLDRREIERVWVMKRNI